MNQVLKRLDDSVVKRSIIEAINKTNSLDEAIFSSEVSQHWNKPEFKQFIDGYVNEKYDFTPYQKSLGEDIFNLLNNMQDHDPNKRPTIIEILDIIKPKEPEIKLDI